MLDDFDKLREVDREGFLASLSALPGSYDGPTGLRPEPYGLVAFGESAALSRVLASWVDAPVVATGTQFLLASGFDFGELAALRLSAELAGAEPVVIGFDAYAPTLRVPPGPLATYHYLSYLAHATGHAEVLAEAEAQLVLFRDCLGPHVETAQNPAKALAWALWNRVPLLLAGRADAALPDLLQRVLARVGKSLAISLGEHPLEVLSSALEGRHQLGDDLVAIIVGPEDDEMALAREVLSTRVAQVEQLTLPFAGLGSMVPDPGGRALVLWYIAVWVAAYVALLHRQSPADNPVYREVLAAAGSKG